MYLVDFAGCCTAKIITGFGQEDTAEMRYRPYREDKEIKGLEESLRRHIRESRYKAVLVATFTQNQTNFKKLAEHYGFIISEPMKKDAHEENVLHLAYLHLHKYEMPALLSEVKVESVRPRDAKGRFIKKNPFEKAKK